MQKRHLLFVFRSSPYGSGRAREGLDAVLAAAIFDQTVSVLFLGDGVFQLCAGQAPDDIRNQHKMLQSLPLYDVEYLYFSSSALAERRINAQDILIPGKPLSDPEIADLMATADQILPF